MTNPDLTHIEFLLDRSGSMESIKDDIEGGFNAYIAEQAKDPGECTVSLTQFDNQFEPVFTAVDIKQVGKLNLVPRGGTALLDALGQSIAALGQRLSALPEDQRPGTVIFAIMTDGMENASREFTHAAIKEMITRQEKEYNWQFLYMGADQDAIEVGMSIGIDQGRSLSYSRGRSQEAYAASSKLTSALKQASKAGAPMADVQYEPADRTSTQE